MRFTRSLAPATLAVAAIAAAPLAGCAEERPERFTGESRRVAEVVDDLGAAARERDAASVCSRILSRSVTKRLGRDCPARVSLALASVEDASLEVVNVRVQGDEAAATVLTSSGEPPRSGDLKLVREPAGWRVAALGPLPPVAPS